MSVTHPTRELAASDLKLVRHLNESLRLRLPDHPAEVIEEHVSAVLEGYRDCRVRDFLPILVEREVVSRLTR